MRSSLYLNFEKRMLFDRKEVKLPLATDDEKVMIKNFFKSSNELLSLKYGISREKLVKYGYI
jgi:hypothetical protein